MIICDFCKTEVPPEGPGFHLSSSVGWLGQAVEGIKLPEVQGDFHPECVEPWMVGAKDVHGERPEPQE